MTVGPPPDAEVLEAVCGDPAVAERVRVWEPRTVTVVLGRGNRPEVEVNLAACRADGVPLRRRLGGGGAVVLGPGCVVVSLARRVSRPTAVREHMAFGVQCIAAALTELGGPRLTARGLGDLCIGSRKVLGSSGFRRSDVFFYQASLLVAGDLAAVERYLKHPSSEPAYRAGRSHREFLTTLQQEGWSLASEEVVRHLARRLTREAS